MRFNTLCSCLLLLVAVQAHPEGSWQWESSGQSSNPTTVIPTVQPATEDSLHLSVAGITSTEQLNHFQYELIEYCDYR